MKIRNGFVSNSSSSSFLIYGTGVSCDKIKGIADKLRIKTTLEYDGEKYEKEDYDFAEDIAKELGLSYVSGPSDHYFYFGRCPSSIKDDETGLQFKQSVEKPIKELLGEEYKCTYHEEAWQDG